ncbi:MAG: TlpA family protein disulfide reductase [Saprospiraceae bacterium]|nr:TlpA family protein disulfide reductase [Saprospiraceae bacterium]MDW8482914.1 TlpA disulfide reductase family protein [Saprospiraceae bacterium]
MRKVYAILLSFLLAPCALRAQVFKIYENFSELEERIAKADGNKLLVINFWATYCKPCVKELPFFNQLYHKYGSQNFEILLVSLDFRSQLEKKFVPFLRSYTLQPEVILLSDQDADSWIPRVQPEWDGAIPLTMLVRGKARDFHVGEFESFEELEHFIHNFFQRVGLPQPPINDR